MSFLHRPINLKNPKHFLSLLLAVFIFLVIPLTVFLVSRPQELRKKAEVREEQLPKQMETRVATLVFQYTAADERLKLVEEILTFGNLKPKEKPAQEGDKVSFSVEVIVTEEEPLYETAINIVNPQKDRLVELIVPAPSGAYLNIFDKQRQVIYQEKFP